jgi:hypothetical protein
VISKHRQNGFRAWLAGRLLGTKYATSPLADDEIDAAAKKLGVDPDLLVEVRAEARIALYEKGLAPPISNKPRKPRSPYSTEPQRRLYQYRMWMPRGIAKVWEAECQLRGVRGPALLRSLIHHYLLGAREPAPEPTWRWEGRLYSFDREKDLEERATLPHGTKRALMRRSKLRNVPASAVVRALMLEAMRGEHRALPPLQAAQMFDDETRYNLGDSVGA